MEERHETTCTFEWYDIPAIEKMENDEYRRIVEGGEPIRIDHHEVLRCSLTGYPLAVYKEQAETLIEHLKSLSEKMPSKKM